MDSYKSTQAFRTKKESDAAHSPLMENLHLVVVDDIVVRMLLYVQAYLDRAIEMQSTEYSLLHSRGRFSYEVANLSWIEKRLCSALFSEVPHGTIDEALNDFLEVRCNILYILTLNI